MAEQPNLAVSMLTFPETVTIAEATPTEITVLRDLWRRYAMVAAETGETTVTVAGLVSLCGDLLRTTAAPDLTATLAATLAATLGGDPADVEGMMDVARRLLAFIMAERPTTVA